MDFIPNTVKEKEDMLNQIGVVSVNDLFKDIPSGILLKKDLNINKPMDELAVKNRLKELASKNNVGVLSFLGAGSYNHFIPSIVDHIISRSEFYTAYTPYQPEISQGILQAIYEYQTMIADLMGMDVANASMYDGASALAESCIMAANITKRNQILILKSVHPDYRQVVKTYCKAHGFELLEIEEVDLDGQLTEKTAAVLVQNPDFFGRIIDLGKISQIIHDKNALLVVNVVEPTSLGLLKSPGSMGADIVTGEGQSFGNLMNFGGPYLGIMATKDKYKRNIPGRLVGATVDTEGERGFVLTLQAREQHIRREKAPSNICSNEALCALAATVHLSALGKQGIKELAELNIQKAHYLADKLCEAGFELVFDNLFYNEFVIKIPNAKKLNDRLMSENKIMCGLLLEDYYSELKDCLLFCVTEVISKEDMDKLVELIK
ncbi:MAG: aminomethyl-transferring glycine dehydrogenase subunit GcvPA [Nanoarchaeota archaeon]